MSRPLSGRDLQLPRGDRDDYDEPERLVIPEPEPEVPLTVEPPRKGEGFGSWLVRIDEEASE